MRFPNQTYYLPIAYTRLIIYRSNYPTFGFTSIYDGPYLEVFNDSGLTNYKTYYYRVVVGASGSLSGYSIDYEAIPKLCTIAPEATVIINGGNKTTDTNKVTLQIIQTYNDGVNNSVKTTMNATHMRVANSPEALESAPWVPYSEFYTWYLTKGSGIKFVFVQLRDNQAVPEVSPIFSAGIKYTGATFEIGIETEITLFLIIVNLVVIALIFNYKKRNTKKYLNTF